jgi:hypothetical protein
MVGDGNMPVQKLSASCGQDSQGLELCHVDHSNVHQFKQFINNQNR